MLWFPLQGAAAAVLSVCAQENIRHHSVHAVYDNNDHHNDCHKQQSNENNQEHLLASLLCDDFSCKAYSHTPIPLNHTAAIAIGNISFIVSYRSGFVSFIPEQPQHPPLIG